MENSLTPSTLNEKRALIFCENDQQHSKTASQLKSLGVTTKFSTSPLGAAALLRRAEYLQQPFDFLLIDSEQNYQAAINTGSALCLHLKSAPNVLLLANVIKGNIPNNLKRKGVKGILKNNFSNGSLKQFLGQTLTLSA